MKPETAKALMEMVRVAAKQFAGYDGPVTVTVCGVQADRIEQAYNEQAYKEAQLQRHAKLVRRIKRRA